METPFLVHINKEFAKVAFLYYPIYFRVKKRSKLQKRYWFEMVDGCYCNFPNKASQYFMKQVNFQSKYFLTK